MTRSADRRSTTNRHVTGNSYDRRRRKQWLLDTFGDGISAPCSLACHPACLAIVTFATIWVDRIIPGCEGGTYRRDNIQPACGPCNMSDGGKIGVARKRGKR